MKVLIISGGFSSERKISLISAKAVGEALVKNGHLVGYFDLKSGYPVLKAKLTKFDLIFPVLHGEEGEGGNLQEFLLKSGKSFVGGNPKGFKKAWPKIPFKKYCDKNKITTSKWQIVKSEKDLLKFGFPSVLKASNGGSSREVVMLKSPKDLNNKIVKKLLKSNLELFVEEYLTGVELTAGVLGNQVLPLIEIIPPEGSWFSYQNKYSGVSLEIPYAPSIEPKLQKKIQDIALKIHQHFNLGSFSRIDFMVKNNIPYVLEVNTIPGLTPESLFPKEAKAAGFSFEQMVEKLIELRYN